MVFSQPGESSSFPRTVTIPSGAEFVFGVRSVLWWDWGIRHL